MLAIINRCRRYVLAGGRDAALFSQNASLIGSLFLPLRYREYREYAESFLARGFEGEKFSFVYDDPISGNVYQVTGVPLKPARERIEQLLVVWQDVTAIKNAERDLRNTLEKSKQLNEIKTRFVTSASHEFRTPLAAILSSASLIGMYNAADGERQRTKHLRRIAASVSRLTELLDTFLSIGKLDTGGFHIQKDIIVLNDIVNEVVDDLSHLDAPGRVIPILDSPVGFSIVSDKQMLRNILTNLVSNALKFSLPGGQVMLTVTLYEGSVVITVTDHGIGIPEGEQKHVFDLFFRASNTENIGGIGMGLNIARKYVELLGGTITFHSQPGNQTTFEVRLQVENNPQKAG